MAILEVERFVELLAGHGIVSKLQKTKDIIDAKVDRARHSARPFLGANGFREILVSFAKFLKPFFGRRGLIGRPTHDRLAALRQANRNSPKGEYKGGGKTWPASLSFFARFPSNVTLWCRTRLLPFVR